MREGPAPETIKTDRDDDTTSNRVFALTDRETRERIAREGGEESHWNDDRRSSSSSGGSGGSQGGREEMGTRYDPETGKRRDESGRFVGCPGDEPGSGQDPNVQRVVSRGGEHSHGGSSFAGSSGRD